MVPNICRIPNNDNDLPETGGAADNDVAADNGITSNGDTTPDLGQAGNLPPKSAAAELSVNDKRLFKVAAFLVGIYFLQQVVTSFFLLPEAPFSINRYAIFGLNLLTAFQYCILPTLTIYALVRLLQNKVTSVCYVFAINGVASLLSVLHYISSPAYTAVRTPPHISPLVFCLPILGIILGLVCSQLKEITSQGPRRNPLGIFLPSAFLIYLICMTIWEELVLCELLDDCLRPTHWLSPIMCFTGLVLVTSLGLSCAALYLRKRRGRGNVPWVIYGLLSTGATLLNLLPFFLIYESTSPSIGYLLIFLSCLSAITAWLPSTKFWCTDKTIAHTDQTATQPDQPTAHADQTNTTTDQTPFETD